MNEHPSPYPAHDDPISGLGLARLLGFVARPATAVPFGAGAGGPSPFTLFRPAAGRSPRGDTRRGSASRPCLPVGRILVMDDDEHLRALTGGMVESLGYQCDLAAHGAEAVQLFQRSLKGNVPYDVAVLDLNVVGGMGGDEAFRHLRALDPSVRAVMISGHDSDDYRQRCLDLGFCAYLAKPYRVTELGRCLRLALEG